MKLNWPELTFPPINLWVVGKRMTKEEIIKRLENACENCTYYYDGDGVSYSVDGVDLIQEIQYVIEALKKDEQ